MSDNQIVVKSFLISIFVTILYFIIVPFSFYIFQKPSSGAAEGILLEYIVILFLMTIFTLVVSFVSFIISYRFLKKY